MKRSRIIGIAIFIVLVSLFLNFLFKKVDTGFATQVYLRYHYGDKKIDVRITDRKDIKEIKSMLSGYSCPLASCAGGYDDNISVTLTDGHKRITFYPVRDMCGSFRINKTNYYLDASGEQRKKIFQILAKYGMTFPCV